MRWTLLLTAALAAAAGGVTQAQTFRTAQWEIATTLVSLDAPNLPENAQQGLRRTIEAIGGRQCLGGGSGDVIRDLRNGITQGFSAGSAGGNCTFSDGDAASNGFIHTQATCRPPSNAFESRLALAGTYTESSIDADLDMLIVLPNDPSDRPAVRIRAHLTGRARTPCGQT